MIEYILDNITFKNIIGILLIITGIFDAWKYIWQSRKIIHVGTAKGHSRKFINMAITNDLIRITYSLIIQDKYLIGINIIALMCMINLWFTIYTHYPYRYRNLLNWKRPSLFLYIINSLLPNKIRKHLWKKYNEKLHIHHIDYCKNNCKRGNLITLCKKCNTKANYNRDYWYAYFKKIIGENIWIIYYLETFTSQKKI